ncbi:carbamoyltransferase HypF [Ralstonia chuxiongensis]|uniref:carbamoyltransferase HypF n=1 Tax=Ralstonia chuxiongensis TaxID=2957504 RepID=UPI0028F6BFC1|nr:carbamoyltransferase HypF [Ralstonia chuxiongensis]CAJ0780180.1 Carbamoyltransferase HypF [Ralstonia chuxiongensis]
MSQQMVAGATDEARQRLLVDVYGTVQGVGFRPLVHRLAVSEGLGGLVRNTGDGVAIEVEGSVFALQRFLSRLEAEIAPPALMREQRIRPVPAQGEEDFVIAPSTLDTSRLPTVLPDLAVCPACLAEMSDPQDRRYRYPFITCVHCGPRYSILEATPYDRVRTTMRHFAMCAACQAEYDDPGSRRFHAQTNACPACGPRIKLWDGVGREQAADEDALNAAADALRQGLVVALKGIGGFQLLVDARSEAAVRRLRERKRRHSKPFALMVPTVDDAAALASISMAERALLCSAAAPIVLLRARALQALVAPSVAPANAWLGILLPCTPLHHLLMGQLGFPVVATSGNRGSEPIVADERTALDALRGLADVFLVHDRVIAHPVDDSVVRVISEAPTVLRHARGYAPQSLDDSYDAAPCLALGAHEKSAVAIAAGPRIVLGPYIGNLEGAGTRAAFARATDAMRALYHVRPNTVACDTHPDYYSTQCAERGPVQPQHVPHHLAHVLAGMVDNALEGPVLGVVWDGGGNGADRTVWGGEFLAVEDGGCRRVAHFWPFRLPGGEAAVREPRRTALGVLHAVFGEAALSMADLPPLAAFSLQERRILATMLARGVNAPLTTSVGRLFDAAAAILGLCQRASFDGEAAIALESAADRAASDLDPVMPLLVAATQSRSGGASARTRGSPLVIDWRPTFAWLVHARCDGIAMGALARAFHDALAQSIVAVAARIGIRQVLLTGGCFQNARLTERAITQLRAAGSEPYWHHRVPPNDGGLAVGQAAFAATLGPEETT